MIECVANVSEGRNNEVLARLSGRVAATLLDLHADPFHHRSVFSLLGTESVRALADEAVRVLDLGEHEGVHPRVGVVDVVPFVPLAGATLAEAVTARNDFAAWAADTLGVPCFLYGPERSLPDVRRGAWNGLAPDWGPDHPHPTAGSICVGARTELVAYNVYLRSASLTDAKRIAASIRGPHLRTLGLQVGEAVQVSMNLVSPALIGPAQAYDAVARQGDIDRAELVGLVNEHVLERIPRWRWAALDLAADRTVEARISGLARATA